MTQVLLVLPPAVGYHEGFSESIYLVKRLAENLGVPLRAVTVGSHLSPEGYERLIGRVDPEMAVTVSAVDGWTGLDERLMEGTRSDLVVPVKPREGSLGWAPELRRLPGQVVDAPPEAFVVVTPRGDDPEYAARFMRMD